MINLQGLDCLVGTLLMQQIWAAVLLETALGEPARLQSEGKPALQGFLL